MHAISLGIARIRFTGFLLTLLLLVTGLLCPIAVYARQDDASELGEAAGPVRELRAIKDKTVIFVFDVSGSMRGENMHRARTATIHILRDGTNPGDRVILYTFGAGYKKVFDETLANQAAKDALIDQVPSKPEPGEGTNIRRPHYEALKVLDAALPHPGAIILLTDSFNDEPNPSDPTYQDYIRFYTPGGRLTRYPDTPENRDYERLLKKLARSRKVTAYGIGIQIDESTGRPIERLPQAAHMDDAPEATPTPEAAPVRPKPTSPLPYILLAAVVVIAALVAFFLATMNKAFALRISGGPAGAKDFSLKSGQPLRLGGKGANFAADAYPLPGLDDPVAEVRVSGGQIRIAPIRAAVGTTPAPANPSGGGGNPQAGPRVFHNGLPLEKEEPLSYGDEVRVSAPDPNGGIGMGREFRLKFDDPRKSF